ncbi:hypothetical protein P152DRAFT_470933 [Eremomyces bilateralis CBS 781.70]|uniref:Uncharacterized protein n=1 Tax=Eremomyces bilateralis CBS 781.70 TaxID=1392243 RepID=A0A6G1GC74_9PEZI|nr:uncharacterized protein P152DRAFT_470933 [Eremomyces bilateralis CBS 781.70]KAF1815500.1 hypothetical protein P152DRAFT_470933 [Eremomyces bilateralis CBS 781.70]
MGSLFGGLGGGIGGGAPGFNLTGLNFTELLQGGGPGGGSGAYKANYTTDSTLVNMTIYAPLTPPTDVELPVLIFGE